MSRIYNNQPLQNLPVININWPTKWDMKTWTKTGPGVIMEAVLKGKSRFAVTDSEQKKERYFIFHVEVSRAHKRKFDSSGTEIEPNFSETTKVSTGFLNSSYRVDPKGKTDKLTSQELSALVVKSELEKQTAKYVGSDNNLSLWVLETQLDKMELDLGDTLRIKTEGDSPFIFSIGKMDAVSAQVSNYAGGEQVGASWTDKIMNLKANLPEDPSNEDNEIADDEWDD